MGAASSGGKGQVLPAGRRYFDGGSGSAMSTVTELLTAVVALFLASSWLASTRLALAGPYHRPLPLWVARVVGLGWAAP